MKQKITIGVLAATIGMVLAVVAVESMKVDGNFTKLDSTVEHVMIALFKSPPPVTDHGWNVDRVIVFVHLLMGILFVGWTLYFVLALIKFNDKAHPKADYHGVKSKVGTTLAEYGVIVAEVVLIASFAVPLWADVMDEEQIAKIKAASKDKKNGLEVNILAKQFDWNARYAGNDGRFASQSLLYANKVSNPFGLNPNDPTIDDVTVLTARSKENAIVVPWDRPIALKITSMDVIHSFKVLPIRVCKDAIPGLQLPIHFKINSEHLKNSEGKSMDGKDDEHIYLITCAQLCGDGHGYMNGYIKAVHPDKFDKWLSEQSQAELKKRVDAKKDTSSK
jgi:cytochrome c oxidase subunit 2